MTLKQNAEETSCGLCSDRKGRFYAFVILSHLCMEMKCVMKTNQGVTGPVAQTAQCEVNATDTTMRFMEGNR